MLSMRAESVLRLSEQMSCREVADALGVSRQAVWDTAKRLRKRGYNIVFPRRSPVRVRYAFPTWYIEMVSLIAQGLTVSTAARSLRRSPRTAFFALTRMRRFLQLQTNLQLVAWAHQNGVIDDDCLPKPGYKVVLMPVEVCKASLD